MLARLDQSDTKAFTSTRLEICVIGFLPLRSVYSLADFLPAQQWPDCLGNWSQFLEKFIRAHPKWI